MKERETQLPASPQRQPFKPQKLPAPVPLYNGGTALRGPPSLADPRPSWHPVTYTAGSATEYLVESHSKHDAVVGGAFCTMFHAASAQSLFSSSSILPLLTLGLLSTTRKACNACCGTCGWSHGFLKPHCLRSCCCSTSNKQSAQQIFNSDTRVEATEGRPLLF